VGKFSESPQNICLFYSGTLNLSDIFSQ
jgi:hypothetical protein